MARQLRVWVTAPEQPAGLEGNLGLKIPNERIRGALSGFLDAAARRIAEAGGALLRLLPLPESTAAAKPVARSGAPARVPAGRRVYAVGDIHGRADLLIRLLEQLRADVAGGGFEGRPILIFLGDYIDRGFQSKDVINVLLGDTLSPFETYFLKGNHEAAMLQFLGDPGIGPRWAEYGGAETLVSYGVQPPRARTNIEEWAQASDELHKALPMEHLHFLQNLDLSVRIGDYVFVHAGVRPGVPLDQQTEQDLLWIREEFLGDRRLLEAVVVHGHTPVPQPYQDGRRIGIDTGAYLSGALTAARFEHDMVEFITTGARVELAQPARV
jgi:serine/threonine protein phosphatase 1